MHCWLIKSAPFFFSGSVWAIYLFHEFSELLTNVCSFIKKNGLAKVQHIKQKQLRLKFYLNENRNLNFIKCGYEFRLLFQQPYNGNKMSMILECF